MKKILIFALTLTSIHGIRSETATLEPVSDAPVISPKLAEQTDASSQSELGEPNTSDQTPHKKITLKKATSQNCSDRCIGKGRSGGGIVNGKCLCFN